MIASAPLPLPQPAMPQLPVKPGGDVLANSVDGTKAATSFTALLSRREEPDNGAISSVLVPKPEKDLQKLADLAAAPIAVPFVEGGIFGAAVQLGRLATGGSDIRASGGPAPLEPPPSAWQSVGEGTATFYETAGPLASPYRAGTTLAMAVAPGSAELDPAEQTKFTTLRSGRVTAAAPAGETAVRQVDLPKSPIDLQSLTQRARAIGSAEVSDCPRVAEPSNIALRPAMPSAHQANIVHPAAEIRALASPLQPTGNSSALRGAAWEPVPRPNPVRAASRPATADRQAQLSSSQPVSVTLHADGGVVQLVARIGGGPQSAEFMRLSSQLLAEGGLSLSGLILDGRRLGRASRR